MFQSRRPHKVHLRLIIAPIRRVGMRNVLFFCGSRCEKNSNGCGLRLQLASNKLPHRKAHLARRRNLARLILVRIVSSPCNPLQLSGAT